MKNILISRTDALGDVILTLPFASILKEYYPDSKIFFLSKDYSQGIIERYKDIDKRISYDQLINKEEVQQVNFLKSFNFDICFHVFPRKELAYLMKKSNIPLRVGSSRKIYHWLNCNKKTWFTRKNSPLHESQLNLKLLKPIGIDLDLSIKEIEAKFNFDKNSQSNFSSIIDKNKLNLIIHPFAVTGARWPIEKYQDLINQLDSKKFNLILTGIQSDIKSLPDSFPLHKVKNFIGKTNLNEFIDLILESDALLAGSTGPLHIASALGKKTLGLYPNQLPVQPSRWKPIGQNANYIVFDKNDKSDDSVTKIPVKRVLKYLNSEKFYITDNKHPL